MNKNIAYQKAWDKISKYIKENGFETYFIDNYTGEPCKLYIFRNGERVYKFIESEEIK